MTYCYELQGFKNSAAKTTQTNNNLDKFCYSSMYILRNRLG